LPVSKGGLRGTAAVRCPDPRACGNVQNGRHGSIGILKRSEVASSP
jgi:hypothetical protein